MSKVYDATKEFKPFELSGNLNGRHPRPRKGATAKKLKMREARRTEPVVAAPTKSKKK
jgi:hypothetical protein